MTVTDKALKDLFAAARPLVEQALDLTEQFAALRDAATAQGIDWSQVKALLKATVQDERDGGNRRLSRVLEKAEDATAYADMLGLAAKVNEENYFPVRVEVIPHDPSTGEILEPDRHGSTAKPEAGGAAASVVAPPDDFPELPAALDRRVA